MTATQFTILMNAVGDLREEMNVRFDKQDRKLDPLWNIYQQEIGADAKATKLAGLTRSTIAIVVSIGTLVLMAIKTLSGG